MENYKEDRVKLYMDLAARVAQQSVATRLKVGCVIVKNDNPIALSWNGTPMGVDNCCEEKDADGNLVTKKIVIHAEENAIIRLAKMHESTDGAVMFITHAPCIVCAPRILQAGFKHVFFENEYKTLDGVRFLLEHGVNVTHFIREDEAWKDHNTAELVNDLKRVSVIYHDTQQLRERIKEVIIPAIDKIRGQE